MTWIERLNGLDAQGFFWVHGKSGRRVPDVIFYVLSKSGDGQAYAGIALFLIAVDITSGLHFLKCALVAFSIQLTVYKITKQSFKRSRPCDHLTGVVRRIIPPDQFSFPSGHTAAAFVMVGLMASSFPMAYPLMLFWGILIGISRIYLGVHYPTDIVAGAALGLFSAMIGKLGF